MPWLEFLNLSETVNCITKSINRSQCICLCLLLVGNASFWPIVRKVTCVYDSSAVPWRRWNQKSVILTHWLSEILIDKVTHCRVGLKILTFRQRGRCDVNIESMPIYVLSGPNVFSAFYWAIWNTRYTFCFVALLSMSSDNIIYLLKVINLPKVQNAQELSI